ncbi:DNA alkylation repair protein [Allokutzneria sp. NRRL B-24872]|uniref:DNA alkylation repair protein n=1 Tax=Allokutzneria sp. NRRL B-24872 TaxID=1137961 RepID=UPI000A36CCA7|nr:DNA alkylation repair protein [Allokutzneria sp. NRRL B-24872]
MNLTAESFLSTLRAFQSDAERAKTDRHFRGSGGAVIGVRMKTLFDTAAQFVDMPLSEVEMLLDSPYYEARMGAVSVLDFKARRKRISDAERRELYELYLRRHDRIDSWDLVDRAAPRVIGWYLLDKPRDPLHALARSSDTWERRTAITATFWLIRQGEVDDALSIAELLLDDEEELIHKSVGTALREVGKIDQDRLVAFLRGHSVPRVTLRYATEKLPAAVRADLLKRA